MMGEMVGGGDRNLIGRLVSIACQQIAQMSVWQAVPHLTGAQAKHAAGRLQRIQLRHVPIQEALKGERDATLLWIQELFAGKWQFHYIKDCTKLPDHIKAKVFNDFTAYMDACIRNVQPSRNPLVAVRNAPADIILLTITPQVDGAWFADVRCETQNRLLIVALALQAYRADHGRYPDRLSELVPAYMAKIPVDLFALKGKLRYRRDDGKYVLWSVGPDGVDDNGRPATDPTKSSASPWDRHYVTAESKGDIVAGVNL